MKSTFETTVLPRYTATREVFGGKRGWRYNEGTQLCMDTGTSNESSEWKR